MRALVYTAPHTLAVMEVDPPQAKAGEEVLTVRATGICGSELEGFSSASPFRVPPLVMGHEIAAERADGELVAINPLIWCGHCDLCLQGRQNLCRSRRIVGINQSGGFAEHVVVPDANIYPLPPGVSIEAAAIAEPLANAVHAMRLAVCAVPSVMRLGIIGGGALGLCTALVALMRGVPDVVVADLSEERRRTLREAGVPSAVSVLEGEFDIIVDAVGSASTRRLSVELLRPGGSTVWLGLHEEDPGFASLPLIRWEKSVLASFCYTEADFRAAVALTPRVATSWIATAPLSRGDEVFLSLLRGPVAASKTLLVPDATFA